MTKQNRLSIFQIDTEHPEIRGLLTFAVGNPTKEKLEAILENYKIRGKLIGCFSEKLLIGLIGFRYHEKSLIIQHLSVLPEYRLKGIGTMLVNYLKANYSFKILIAETDQETVHFYEKLNFSCLSIESKWPNRYQCTFTPK